MIPNSGHTLVALNENSGKACRHHSAATKSRGPGPHAVPVSCDPGL